MIEHVTARQYGRVLIGLVIIMIVALGVFSTIRWLAGIGSVPA
ncbi:hypothetical protein AB7813_08745 [Tardiphaga sp. 20_F10_N6_6]